jgi:filamentous hemagglutinin family protein
MSNRDRHLFSIPIQPLLLLTLSSWLIEGIDPVFAQIRADDTLGSERSIVTPNVVIKGIRSDRIDGGARRGANLFHSFGQFIIPEGRGAYFSNPDGIRTIFSRVTGGNGSQILGTLGVLGDANLFLIDPKGIIFGENATLDISGSFIASTANSLVFPNGENFSATNPNAAPLLTIDVPVPVGLVFESDNSGIILNAADLKNQQNLALVAGGILSSGQISAPGGNITLATVAGAINSVVRLDETGKFLGTIQGIGQPNLQDKDIVLIGGAIDASSNGRAGNVVLNSAGNTLLSNGATVDVRGAGGGSITVNAQNLGMSGGSQLQAGIGQGLEALGDRAGDIEINATQSVKIEGNANSGSSIGNSTRGLGNAGDVIINTETLEGTGNFAIASGTFGRGNGGKVAITATDKVSLEGLEATIRGVLSFVQPSASGNGGDIVINARSLSLSNNAFLSSVTTGTGNAGNIQINVPTISMTNRAGLSSETFGKGESGNLTINTRQLSVRDGAAIAATAERGSEGDAGNLTINATGSIQLIGTSADGQSPSRLTSATLGKGKAGNLSLTTRQLLVRDGALIVTTAEPESEGDAGNLTINASELVQLSGTSTDERPSGSRLTSSTLGQGNAGDLSITTKRLLVQNGAGIAAGSQGEGDAGNLTINASELVQLNGNPANNRLSAITTLSTGNGDAGDLEINTRQLLVRDGASILTTTLGEGRGGDLKVDASESVRLIGNSFLATATTGQGNAGNIFIKASESVALNGGSALRTNTFSSGNAGNISIEVEKGTVSFDGAETGASTSVSRDNIGEIPFVGTGRGGDISIEARSLSVTNGARLLTSTNGERGEQGLPNAGDIKIDISDAVSLDSGAQLRSDTSGVGNAGKIEIAARSLSATNGSQISASTLGQGKGGNIVLRIDEIATFENGAGVGSVVAPQATGEGGNIDIQARSLSLSNGAIVSTTTGGAGKGGNLNINANQSVQLFGTSANSGLITGSIGKGNAGNLEINTEQLLVRDRAVISTTTVGTGKGGNLNINASDSVQVIGTSANSTLTAIATGTNGKGDAGDLEINTGQLLVRDGAIIITDTNSTGNGGDLTVNASESVQLIGFAEGGSSRLTSITTGKGDAGDLNIKTGQLLIRDRAAISTTTNGEGKGGNLSINASDSVSLDRGFVFSGVLEDGKNNSGNIDIRARSLSVTNGSFLLANTEGVGNAGNIEIKVDKTVTISGVSAQTLNVSDSIIPSLIASSVDAGGEGRAGNINIQAKSLSLDNVGVLSNSTSGQGNASNISIKVDRSVTLENTSFIQSNVERNGVGIGGNVDIQARSLTLKDGSEIQTGLRAANDESPGGIGKGGNININTSDFVEISGTSPRQISILIPINPNNPGEPFTIEPPNLSSGLFTSTQTGASGPAGNIFVTTRAFRLADGAVVEAPTANFGRAGDITINANTIDVTGGAQIISATRGSGNAGDIRLRVKDSLTLS